MHQNLGQAEVATGKQQNPVAARGVACRGSFSICRWPPLPRLLRPWTSKDRFPRTRWEQHGRPALGGRSPVCGA